MFFFRSKKKPARAVRQPKPASAGETAQKRSAFRMPVEFDVMYALDGRSERREARADGLSAAGLRLFSDEDFLEGSLLTLEFKLPDAFLANMTVEKELYEQSPFGLRPEIVKVQPHAFAPVRLRGTILGSSFDPHRAKFAHGIEFAGIDNKAQEELQRFIHLWQLNYIRTHRGDLD